MTTQNIYALTDLWNAGGTTFKGIALDVTDTASASGSLLMDLQVGSVSQFQVTKAGAVTALGGITSSGNLTSLSNAGSLVLGVSSDVVVVRDTADTLAQRRGTNAQAFRLYNTYTDASNYERLGFSFISSSAVIRPENAGTGSARALILATSGGSGVFIRAAAATTGGWQFNSSNHLLAETDNTYDIGASGATRPRNVYVAGAYGFSTTSGNSYITSGTLGFYNYGGVSAAADGVFQLANNAQTDFSRLQFGGTTSSFPSLKRSSATLQARLADDSAFAPVQGKITTDTAYTAGDPVTTGYLTLYDSNGTAYKVPAVAA
jgi:hypothetical protein